MISVPQHDQTDPNWVISSREGDLGTGVFASVTFESGMPEPLIQAVADITLEQALSYGKLCLSFKWVPHSVVNTDDVHILCATDGLRCYHISTCGAGCICIGGVNDHVCRRPSAIYRSH